MKWRIASLVFVLASACTTARNKPEAASLASDSSSESRAVALAAPELRVTAATSPAPPDVKPLEVHFIDVGRRSASRNSLMSSEGLLRRVRGSDPGSRPARQDLPPAEHGRRLRFSLGKRNRRSSGGVLRPDPKGTGCRIDPTRCAPARDALPLLPRSPARPSAGCRGPPHGS